MCVRAARGPPWVPTLGAPLRACGRDREPGNGAAERQSTVGGERARAVTLVAAVGLAR